MMSRASRPSKSMLTAGMAGLAPVFAVASVGGIGGLEGLGAACSSDWATVSSFVYRGEGVAFFRTIAGSGGEFGEKNVLSWSLYSGLKAWLVVRKRYLPETSKTGLAKE